MELTKLLKARCVLSHGERTTKRSFVCGARGRVVLDREAGWLPQQQQIPALQFRVSVSLRRELSPFCEGNAISESLGTKLQYCWSGAARTLHEAVRYPEHVSFIEGIGDCSRSRQSNRAAA